MRLGYARLSTAEQAKGQALEQQTSRLKAAGCEEVFFDIESGSNDHRPQLLKVLDRIGPGDSLVATRLDRITRSAAFNNQLVEMFSLDQGPRLECLDDSIDTGSVMGRAAFRMLGVFAQAEVERIRERVQHGMRHRVDVLRGFQGRAPFGFTRPEGALHLEIDPQTAPIAQALIDRFIDTSDARGCCGWLAAEYGIRMSAKGLRYWLENPALVGDTGRAVPRPKVLDPITKKLKRTATPIGVYGRIDPDTHPALITRTKWAEVKRAVATSKHTPGGQRRAGLKPAWFSSRIRCGTCGARMSPHGQVLRCCTEWCEQRYSAGAVFKGEARRDLVRALFWVGREISARLAPVLAAAAANLEDPPGAQVLRDKIAHLRSTELIEVEGVIERLELEMQQLYRNQQGFQLSEAEALEQVLATVGSWAALLELSDADLLRICQDAEIEIVVLHGRVRLVVSRRWAPVAWALDKDGSDLVLAAPMDGIEDPLARATPSLTGSRVLTEAEKLSLAPTPWPADQELPFFDLDRWLPEGLVAEFVFTPESPEMAAAVAAIPGGLEAILKALAEP